MDQSFKLADGYRNWIAFINEIRRIEESMQESRKAEQVLVKKCNQLKSELVVSGNKLHAVMRVRTDDERTMVILREECDRCTREKMEAQKKQKEAQSLVSGLQADIEGLKAQVDVLQSGLWLERERANAAVAENNISNTNNNNRNNTPTKHSLDASNGGESTSSDKFAPGITTAAAAARATSKQDVPRAHTTTPSKARAATARPWTREKNRANRGRGRRCLDPEGGSTRRQRGDIIVDGAQSKQDYCQNTTTTTAVSSDRDPLLSRGVEGGWANLGSSGSRGLHEEEPAWGRGSDSSKFVAKRRFGSGGIFDGGGGGPEGGPDRTPFQRWKEERGIVL